MAESEQKQILVSNDSATVDIDNIKEHESEKLQTLTDEQFVYTEAPVETQVGQDILQQALNEADNVIEGTVIEQPTTVPEETVVNEVSEAQNLLNTLTGETVPPDPPAELETTENVITTNGEGGSEYVEETPPDPPAENEPESEENKIKSPLKTLKNIPLGSSQNPIHIVQQGNTYHSSQDLSKAQLQQIAQVLHKQQIVQALKNGGSSVVYNPDTNTRIVYRVVTPAEALEKNSTLLTRKSGISLLNNSASAVTPIKRGRGRPRKDGSIGGTPVSASRGRGRGRGRKPLNEDLDIGREPHKLTKEELESRKKQRPRTRSGRISRPPSYMVKEYKRIHPLDYHEDDESADDSSDGGYSDYAVSDPDNENSNSTLNADDEEKELENDKKADSPQPPKKVSKHRGRPPLTEKERSEKRKNKLRDAMIGCHNEEVVDVVLPTIRSELTPWELMLERCTNQNGFDAAEALLLFDQVLCNLQKCLSDNLQPVDEESNEKSTIEFIEDRTANLFGVVQGKYKIASNEPMDDISSQVMKRRREEMEVEKVESKAKRLKLDWSNTLDMAAGVDVSISEVGSENSNENKEKSKDNVSMLNDENSEMISIAPVVNNGDVHLKEIQPNQNNAATNDEIFAAIENEVAAMDSTTDATHQDIVQSVDEQQQPQQPVQTEVQEEQIQQQTEASEDVEMVQLSLPDGTVVHAQAGDVAQVVNANAVASEDGQPQTVALLMDNKDSNQEYVATEEQAVVGVIEPQEEGDPNQTAMSTENLLGYLGENLSAEALQPGNIVIIQNPDGTTTTVALSGSEGKDIPMETVQALLAMDSSSQEQQQPPSEQQQIE